MNPFFLIRREIPLNRKGECMKTVCDQHMHSRFSFDSVENIESYLPFAEGNDIVTTEHLEFSNPSDSGRDSAFHYNEYLSHMNELNRNYENNFLCGVEIGYFPSGEEKILEFLKDKHFDLKLLSIHQDGISDFSDRIVQEVSKKDVISNYYEIMIRALESPIRANVLAHFEYVVRYFDLPLSLYLSCAQSYLEKIIELLIEKEMALELNTRSMYMKNNIELYRCMVERYLQKGGRLFTLGSDSHTSLSYARYFKETQMFLLKNGIKEIARFKKGELYLESMV